MHLARSRLPRRTGRASRAAGAAEHRLGMRVVREDRVQGRDRLVCGPRPKHKCGVEVEQVSLTWPANGRGKSRARLRPPSLRCGRGNSPRECRGPTRRTRAPHDSRSLEKRQQRRVRAARARRLRVVRKIGAVRRGSNAGQQFARCVSGRARTRAADSATAAPFAGSRSASASRDRVRSSRQPASAGSRRARAGGGRQRCDRRLARRRCDLQSRDERLRVRPKPVGLAELLLVSRSLLEVVAEISASLDQLEAAPFDPAGISLVQVRAHGLRQSAVGRVPDQQVAKTEAVLTGQLRLLGANQLSPCECSEAGDNCSSSGTRT